MFIISLSLAAVYFACCWFIFGCCLHCLSSVYLWLLSILFIISKPLAAFYCLSSVYLWLLSIVYHQFIFGCCLYYLSSVNLWLLSLLVIISKSLAVFYCLLSVYLWLLFKLFIIGLSSAASSCIIQVIFKELTMFINNWSEGGVIVPGHLDHLYPRLWGFCILLEWGSEPVFNGSYW